jgi:putative CocE/NonD family hydrolase
MNRRSTAVLVVLVVLSATSRVVASADSCGASRPCLPTPQQCADGTHDGVVGGPTWFSLCAGAAGHDMVYAGGTPLGPCGTVVVADQTVAGGGDPNHQCPPSSDALPGSHWQQGYVPAADGTPLHVDVYRPQRLSATARTPVILMDTPYASSGGTGQPVGGTSVDLTPTGPATSQFVSHRLAGLTPALFEDGFTLVVAAVRGFGASGGCDDSGGPTARDDVKTLVEWAARQPWSTGSVGMYGMSADGWTALMGLATRPRGLDAVVTESPPINRYDIAYSHGVRYFLDPTSNAARYAYEGTVPLSTNASSAQQQTWASSRPADARCDAVNVTGSTSTDPGAPFWAERDLLPLVRGSAVPTLLSQGLLDDNLKPTDVIPLWTSLRGPHRAWFGQYDHVQPDDPSHQVGRRGFAQEVLDWFLAYVGRDPTALAAVQGEPRVEVERDDGVWQGEDQWPPTASLEASLALAPGRYTDTPGNSAEAADPTRWCPDGSTDQASRCARTGNGKGTWSIGPQLASSEHLAGTPTLTAEVSTTLPSTNLIALVYDIDPHGAATLLTRGATLLTSSGEHRLRLPLYPQDWLLGAGHRVGALLTGSDDGWWAPRSTGTTVEVRSGRLTLPIQQTTVTALSGTLSVAGTERAPIQVMPNHGA